MPLNDMSFNEGCIMDRLSACVEEFLRVVCRASELEAWEAKLVRVSDTLWSRLEFAEEKGDVDLAASTIQNLGKIGDIQAGVVRELQRINEKAGLQVLARPPE
jgi:hypothetical protein